VEREDAASAHEDGRDLGDEQNEQNDSGHRPGLCSALIVRTHFGLADALDLDAPQLTRHERLDLLRRAHQDCPYSRATRGNIEVTLSVGGVPAEEGRAAA
jgi:hypothetical protein